MPEEFDPRWEYWEPDPEIAEAMAGKPVSDTERFLDSLPDRPDRSKSIGFRVSKLTPYRLHWLPCKLGRARYRVVRERPPRKVYECLKCNGRFEGTKRRLYYCRVCLPGSGHVKADVVMLTCVYCTGAFTKRWPEQRFCSVSCGTLARTSVPTTVTGTDLCRECGVPFPPSRATNGAVKLYCNPKCALKHRNRKHNANRVRKTTRRAASRA